MKFLVYSQITAETVVSSMGQPEYSYYFVLRDFLPVLHSLGEVVVVKDPAAEADQIYDQCQARNEPCWLLSFSPPHKTPLGLRCPTIPVFAWEFQSIPNEYWLDEQEQDWRYGLTQCGSGLSHCQMVVQSVKDELGANFPICSIPSPVWDNFAALRTAAVPLPLTQPLSLKIQQGVVIDSRDPNLQAQLFGPEADAQVRQAISKYLQSYTAPSTQTEADTPAPPSGVIAQKQSFYRITRRYLGEWYLKVLAPHWRPKPTPQNTASDAENERLDLTPHAFGLHPAASTLSLQGVIFTALFNPYDGRKNWLDMLTAFCIAFQDTEDAVLIFKLGHRNYQSVMRQMVIYMNRLPRFKCRVILLHGYLEKPAFETLIHASAFTVNASYGEGQCLPLMEFLSCGKPAIAPRHSALRDYIDDDIAFVVNSWEKSTAYPHDPRVAYRTLRHEIDWSSLRDAYWRAYQCLKNHPARYQQMSANAITRMQSHCSQASARERLEQFLAQQQVCA